MNLVVKHFEKGELELVFLKRFKSPLIMFSTLFSYINVHYQGSEYPRV
jgi:hypothetical protein